MSDGLDSDKDGPAVRKFTVTADPSAVSSTVALRDRPRRFYSTVELDPVTASLKFSKVVSELVERFSITPGTKVTIRVDIEAEEERGWIADR